MQGSRKEVSRAKTRSLSGKTTRTGPVWLRSWRIRPKSIRADTMPSRTGCTRCRSSTRRVRTLRPISPSSSIRSSFRMARRLSSCIPFVPDAAWPNSVSMPNQKDVETFLASYPADVADLAHAGRRLLNAVLPWAEESLDQSARVIGFGHGPRSSRSSGRVALEP